jgi:hypothetical protein
MKVQLIRFKSIDDLILYFHSGVLKYAIEKL